MAMIGRRRMVREGGEWVDYEERVTKTGERIMTLLSDGPKSRRYLGGSIGRDRLTARFIDTALRRLERAGSVVAAEGAVLDRRRGRTWQRADEEARAASEAARKAAEIESGRLYAARTFGIPVADVIWHHGGICYSTVLVRTKEAAERVREKVKGETVNGGWFHGSPLGDINPQRLDDGSEAFRVTC